MLDFDEDTKRVLDGFEREKARTGPPEGFPGFPVIPGERYTCLLYTSPSPRDATLSRMPSSA